MSWGGGGNQIENLCYELSKTNPEVKNIIVVGKGGQFHERLKKLNYNYETVPLSFKMDPRAVFKLIRLCRKEKIDIIHLHGPSSLTLAVIADKFADLPPFVFSKKTSFPIKTRKQTLYKYNYHKIKKMLCVSDETKKVAKKAIIDHSKLKTVYHGTRIDNKSTQTPFRIREKLNFPANSVIIGSIGNHIPAKDLDTWIDTIDILVNKKGLDHLRFVQIGTFTDHTEKFKDRIVELQLEKYVNFLGYMPKASNFIEQFDMLLLTSKSEGLPQVIYEAMYHKTPVVSTNVGGIPEVITHRENGFLSSKENPASLADNVIALLKNKTLAEEFTKKSFEKLIPKFTSENMAMETLKVYQEIKATKK